MRVIIACEFSGVVRRAFRERGHNAFSCDILESEDNSKFHFQMNIFELLKLEQFDLMIFHWPCTRLCNSGVRWLYGGKGTTPDTERWRDMENDANAFRSLLCWPTIPLVCGENPIPHKYARKIMGQYSQVIQPYEFGHGETKATCLWLKGLGKLYATNIVEGRTPRVHHASPGPDRWKERSRTLPGIAKAMAEQWG